MKNKILFATAPLDGHFNPLTGLAMHLKEQGYDVRWYTAKTYERKVQKLGIPFYPFEKAIEFNQENLNEMFPERTKINSSVGKIKFDIKHCFVKMSRHYFEDIQQINQVFPFDMLICDPGLTAGQLVREKLDKRVVVMGISPLVETSKDTYPMGLGLTPASTFFGKWHQAFMRFVSKNVIFKDSTNEYNRIITSYGLQPVNEMIFDIAVKQTDLYLQIGVPGFEYYRSDISDNVHFIGALLPYNQSLKQTFAHEDKLKKYKKVILISQGTVDNKEPEKLIIPTIEAFKDSPYLLIAATGNSKTAELRERYPQENVIIENFIDFGYILQHTDVFVTNGGYGSTMLSLSNNVPLVAAGVHEGKNEICARIGYFNLGINLKTERPTPAQIKQGVEEILQNGLYKKNVTKLQEEFKQYHPLQLSERHISALLNNKSQEKNIFTFVED